MTPRATPEDTLTFAALADDLARMNGAAAEAAAERHRTAARKYKQRESATASDIIIPPVANPARRAACLADLPQFLRTYFLAEFTHPFDSNMEQVCAVATTIINTGGRFVLALPRGSGKTVTMTRASLWALLGGKRNFVVVVGATAGAAEALLDTIEKDLSSNPLLLEDFPEICIPFHTVAMKSGRINAIRYQGSPIMAEKVKGKIAFPIIARDGSAAHGQIIIARGLDGTLRGLTHSAGGASLRPDLVLVDDPQTRRSATSKSQTEKRLNIIYGDMLGLAGPDAKPIAIMVAATVIEKDDLAERLLASNRFVARRFRLVENWGGGDWASYDAIWHGQGPAAAAAWYATHRAELDAGAIVPCAWRIRKGELSALHTARNLLLEMGEEAFCAEMQGEPPRAQTDLFALTESKILANIIPYPLGEIPPENKILVTHTDINRSGLHWCACAFGNDFSAHVVAYGNLTGKNGELWEESATEIIKSRRIISGLKALASMFASAPFVRSGRRERPLLLLIDAGFEAMTVHRFVEMHAYPFFVHPAIGRAAHRYGWRRETIVGRPYQKVHLQKTDKHPSPYVMYDADFWRAASRRALLGLAGTPGAATLFRPQGGPMSHREFAAHLTAEKLVQTYETQEGLRYEWSKQPGVPNDWGDAYTGCFAAAAMAGLATVDGEAIPPKKGTIKTAKI